MPSNDNTSEAHRSVLGKTKNDGTKLLEKWSNDDKTNGENKLGRNQKKGRSQKVKERRKEEKIRLDHNF